MLKRIGIFIHPWHSTGRDMLEGVARFADTRKHWQLVLPWPGYTDWAARKVEGLDGAIIRLGNSLDCPAGTCADLPRIVVGRSLPATEEPHIDWDHRGVGKLGFEHLYEQGHRSLCFVAADQEHYARVRWEGFVSAAERRRIVPMRYDIADAGAGALDAWIAGLPASTGIMAASDAIATRLLESARRVGRVVPDELAVLGVGDDELICNLASPSLSSIMLPGKAAGHAAAEMLDRLLGGQPASACCRIIPCAHVAVRKSTDSLAIDDLLIARVLRLLRRDATSELDMNVIRRAVPLSKRSLEIRFKRAVGRTMEQEVARVRVEQAKRLLARSELRLEEVAAQSGFSCAHRMTVVFSRATGIPPSEYRRRSQMQQVHLNGEGNGHPGE